ncbi:GAF domain-containing protein, partial [Burkholderia pseudomallei]|nr:GAF domain-containing protein [Burkholderia pseudomallei]
FDDEDRNGMEALCRVFVEHAWQKARG